jgi:hypothetical protein
VTWSGDVHGPVELVEKPPPAELVESVTVVSFA